jgi:hypothetical protein
MREQRRLLTLIAMLVIVFVLIAKARQPETWKWLAHGPSTGSDSTGSDSTGSDSAGSDSAGGETERPPITKLLAALRAVDLRAVQDNTVFAPSEKQAWEDLFHVLDGATASELEASSIGNVTYAQLMGQMPFYRGKVVTVSGRVRRAHRVSEPSDEQVQPDNANGGTWQCWLFPGQAGTFPIVVHAREMPASFPSGMQIDQWVTFQAVAYKRWAFAAAEGPSVAPVLLAKRGIWVPPTTVPVETAPNWNPWSLVGGAGLLTALVVLAVRWHLRPRHWRKSPTQITAPPSDNEFIESGDAKPSDQEN